MPINVSVITQEYFNEFKNGTTLVDNPSDFTLNFTGSVMETQKVRLVLDVSWNAQSTDGNKFTVNGTTYTRAAGNWADDGIAVGDAIGVEYYDSIGTYFGIFSKTVLSVSSNVMIVDTTTSIPDGVYSAMNIKGAEPLTALIHKFALIENGDTFNVENIITQSDSAYYGSGMIEGGPWVNFQGLGQNKDWEDGSLKARKLFFGTYTQRFEIEHKLLIPFYSEGDDLSLLPNYLDGLNSLKYVFESGFRTVISNPNTEKTKKYEEQLGSVAGFNENYNGFDNNYEIVSVDYEDYVSGASADGILIAGTTEVKIVVKRKVGVFAGAERFGVYVAYKAEQSDYQYTPLTDFKENFIYDRALNNAGAIIPTAGDVFISFVNGLVNVGGELEITFLVDYPIATKAFLSNRFNTSITEFIIGVNVGDVTLSNGNSDRVMLLAANTLYDESPDIEGLMDVTKFNLYPHDRQIGGSTPSTNMTSWNEDGLVVDFDFDLDLNLDAFINTLDFKLIAYNDISESFFELDSYSYPIGGSVVSGGVQQLNVTTDRGYILDVGDQFNDVTISVGANVANVQTYSGRFAQKVSWQDWIANIDVDNIFYNSAEPNSNKNYKSSNYSDLNNYDIRLAISANLFGTNAFGVSGFTDYLFLSPTVGVFDYTKDGNIPAEWSGVIETFDATGSTNLSLAVLTGQDTLLRTTWTNVNGAVTSLVGLWGINRIEEAGQLGYQITEMSSINAPASGQILKPSTGSLLNVYLNAGNIVMECLIDGSVAAAGLNYNLSSRIHDATGIVDGKLTSPLSETKETSGVVETKIESP